MVFPNDLWFFQHSFLINNMQNQVRKISLAYTKKDICFLRLDSGIPVTPYCKGAYGDAKSKGDKKNLVHPPKTPNLYVTFYGFTSHLSRKNVSQKIYKTYHFSVSSIQQKAQIAHKTAIIAYLQDL